VAAGAVRRRDIVQPAAEPKAQAAAAARRHEWFVPDGAGRLRHSDVEIDPAMPRAHPLLGINHRLWAVGAERDPIL
jgi:hypothetical protein